MPKPMMDIYTFGRQLLETEDIDPVYVVLHKANLGYATLSRWLIGYWCFYHVGTASWLCDHGDKGFWEALAKAAASKEWPRSSERRHFRGQQAIKAVQELRALRQTPSELIKGLVGHPANPTLLEVMDRVKKLRGFGDWIAFKVADMLERLGFAMVRFRPEDVFEMYDSPVKGAQAMWERATPKEKSIAITGKAGEDPITVWAYRSLMLHLGDMTAPPRHERKINIQEIETILCKYKSYLNGHYEVGHDIHEVRSGLLRFARCKTSQRLLAAGKGRLW